MNKTLENEKQEKLRGDYFDKELDNITKAFSKDLGMPVLASFPFKMLVKKLGKDIEKQFKAMDQEMSRTTPQIDIPPNAKKTSKSIIQGNKKIGDIKEFNFPGGQGFSIQINMNGSPADISEENLNEAENENEEFQKNRKKIKFPISRISEKEMAKISKLPKQEPETSVRRLTDKIVYEISLPGVKNKKNVFINKLQNSIEIRAFSDKHAYFKLIPVSLSIKNWFVEKEKLILELKP